jgi:hypothetical protein
VLRRQVFQQGSEAVPVGKSQPALRSFGIGYDACLHLKEE